MPFDIKAGISAAMDMVSKKDEGSDKYKNGKARNKKKMTDAIGGYAEASKKYKPIKSSVRDVE